MATVVQERTKLQEHQSSQTPPPLENGDHLTRQEFHRRYEAMPDVKKAELIEGVVIVPSPARRSHGKQHGAVVTVLGAYAVATPGVELLDTATVFLDADNEVQPDVLLRFERKGASSVTEDDYIAGAPELIFEIAGTSATYDLHDKQNVYRRNGVQEYVVWTLYENALYWFRLEEGRYVLMQPDEAGVIRSQVFPGLHLNAQALLQRDLAAVLETVQAGLASDEHADFVQQLQQQQPNEE